MAASAVFNDAEEPLLEGVCGQTILRLCSRGSAIIAELSRLAEHVPAAFLGVELCDPAERATAARYAPVLFTQRYMSEPEVFDAQVSESVELSDLDDESQATHEAIVGRFYTLFDSIWKYHEDLRSFLEQLDEGFFIQSTLEAVLLDTDGRQLVAEAMALKGMMLLLMDRKIPGIARERLVVAHLRYQGEGAARNVEFVARLCKDSGFLDRRFAERRADVLAHRAGPSGSRTHNRTYAEALEGCRPKQYPLALFARAPVPAAAVSQLLGTLRSDDIYNKLKIFPRPDHRSAALAQQAALVYVVLHFAPADLIRDRSKMRELVDRHFSDSWVLPVYMGFTVDLAREWAEFPAAIAAMQTDTLRPDRVAELARRAAEQQRRADASLRELLAEGALTETTVTDGVKAVLDVLRESNIALRWLMLHRHTSHAGFRAAVMEHAPPDDEMLDMLLRTAEFEFRLKGLLNDVIDKRAASWAEAQALVSSQLSQLAALFQGTIPSDIDTDEGLAEWFLRLAGEVNALDPSRATVAGRKVHKLVLALREVQEFESVDSHPIVVEFLRTTAARLGGMVRLLNVEESVVQHTELIADLSYAWGTIIESLLPMMHDRIQRSPAALASMRALFHKLTSILNIPVARVVQAGSKDLESIAKHYSTQLVAFVRRVMEAVPLVVFQVLERVARVRSESLVDTPVNFEVGVLSSLARLEARHELALRTHQIAVFTDGVVRQEKALLGVIQLDPRAILHDGIRKQLVARVVRALDEALVFDLAGLDGNKAPRGHDPRASVLSAMAAAGHTLRSLHASVEYIQDFIGITGLRMWQEEVSRAFAFYAEQESNRFVRKRVAPDASIHQSAAAPIPLLTSRDGDVTFGFLGRTLCALEALTRPGLTVFSPAADGWFTPEGVEFAGLRMLAALRDCVGVPGLVGLDRLLGFQAVRHVDRSLRRFVAEMRAGASEVLTSFRADLIPTTALLTRGVFVHDAVCKRLGTQLGAATADVVALGHSQLLRRALAHQLRQASSLESGLLFSAADTLNEAVLNDVRRHYHRPAENAFPTAENPLLPQLAALLQQCGVADPMHRIYVTRDATPLLDLWLALIVLANAHRFRYDTDFRTLVQSDFSRGAIDVDGVPFCAGIATLLRQLHPRVFRATFGFLGQYVRSAIHIALIAKRPEPVPAAVVNAIVIMQTVIDLLGLPRDTLSAFVPAHVAACVTSQ